MSYSYLSLVMLLNIVVVQQIKDSARLLRLRRRRSPRGKARAAADRSIGWIIVTLVGLLTALVAFLIVRSEQLLFDLKVCSTLHL